MCRLIIEFFNGISNLLLSRAALALPSQDVGDLNLSSNILFLILWLLILILKSFARLVQIIILIACAPLAGALLMDRSTSSRFRSWFEKLLELLLAQINLAIIFVVITAILQPYAGRGADDAFMSFLLSIVMIGMALSGKSVIGVAGAVMSGGGNGVLSFLKYQVVGSTMRGALSGREGRAGATGAAAALETSQRAAPSSRGVHATGDPAQSAAAQRQAGGPASSSSVAPALTPAGSFRLGNASASLSSQRARARYQVAGQTTRSTAGRLAHDARREQALMRATLMRQRAGTLRESGDRAGAEALNRKAHLQERFGRGQDIARPSRFSAAERVTRREAHRQALRETVGMHALEHDALSQQIQADEIRLPTLQRDLALIGATGGDTTVLHQEQRNIEQRLAIGRARAQAIAPRENGAPSRATRAAAAALANERLAPNLRSSAYQASVLLHGAAVAPRMREDNAGVDR